MIELIPAIGIIDGNASVFLKEIITHRKYITKTRLRLPKNLKHMGFIVCTLSIWMEQFHAML